MRQTKICKFCGKRFYRKDFIKSFNRMITCGSIECKKKLKKEWTYSKYCPDCNIPIVRSANKCHRCATLGENNPFYGKTHTEEAKKKIKLFPKGHIPYIKGKHHSEEAKLKNSMAHKGANHPNWQGGIAIPYTCDWTKTLRRSIRERDNYICQICAISQYDRAFPVHHIDNNKKNCNPKNLITLCYKCHCKTIHKRKYWEKILKGKVRLYV